MLIFYSNRNLITHKVQAFLDRSPLASTRSCDSGLRHPFFYFRPDGLGAAAPGLLFLSDYTLQDGETVGAIGVSGATSQQDGQCARSDAEAFK